VNDPDLPAFPADPACAPELPNSLRATGIALRHATARDLPFLRTLYAQTRAAELDAVGWPRQAREHFVASQFALQHRHYVTHFTHGPFLVVERHGAPVGRLYLHTEAEDMLIVDITLATECRGQGIGSALLKAVIDQASAQDRGVRLHVDLRNGAAHRLYTRLGFVQTGMEGAYRCMRRERVIS
jgi:ribosomal protein S18 acetylase RimI-like enzyme